MMVIRLLYLVWYLLLCQYCSGCGICNDELLDQCTIHLLSGERRWVACVVSHEFEPYNLIFLMARVNFFVCCLHVHMLRVQGWVGIAATCWVSWWLGIRGGTISRMAREIPQWTRKKISDYLMFSLNVWQNLSDEFVVEPFGTVCLIIQNIVLGPLILNYPWCVALVLIPDFSIYHELLLSYSVCRVLFCSWVIFLGYFLHHSVSPPVCSCFLCLIALKISQ